MNLNVRMLRALSASVLLTLAACTDDQAVGGLLDGQTSSSNTVTEAVLTITGPENAAPGQKTTGYLVEAATENGQAIEDQFVGLVPVEGGTIDAPPNRPASFGDNTDAFGRLAFSFTPPNNITTATSIRIRATTTIDGLEYETVFPVSVSPDVFQFTSPSEQAPIQVGSQNAERMQFQWTRDAQAGGGGVTGSIRLTADSGARISVNDDPQNASDTVVVSTSATSGGDFSVPVSVFNNNSGFSTITARDVATGLRRDTLNVQFIDSPGTDARTRNLDADPLIVQTSPARTRFSNLTFTVLNNSFEPVTGIDVTFTLLNGAGGANERIFPGGGTTDAQGQASSTYESGSAAGTVTIRACVRDTANCDEREIEVREPVT